MISQTINRADPEKVFITVRNTSGATFSAGAAVYWEVDAVSDGNAVSKAGTAETNLFAGIVSDMNASDKIVDDAYGLVQTYGVASASVMLGTSAVSYNAGQQMVGVAGQNYLQAFSATSSAQMSAFNFVTLFEHIASAAANSNTAANKSVFIRAM